MREKVVIEKISVSRRGEIKAFQIKLPPDAKWIIGFEATPLDIDVFDSPFDFGPVEFYFFKRSHFLGEARLQSCGKANLFYSADIFLNDRNLGYGDFSQVPATWHARAWSTGYQREEDKVYVGEGCPVIRGYYKDRRGEILDSDLTYSVNLYLWYATEDEPQT